MMNMLVMKKKIIFLVGPTAVGKSEIATRLAKKINAEIISCDSMQIYKGMDLLTAKPTRIQLKKIPHHLIGVIDPSKEYNVSRYRRDALRIIKEIFKKNKTPLFVGGTGLYMSILLDGIFKAKGESKKIRKQLFEEAKRISSPVLHERLKKIDPQAAEKIHPNDTRRIVRALEVFLVTGKPISVLQKERKGLADEYDVEVYCLNMPLEKLYKKINQRVDKMFAVGLVKEVKILLKKKLSKTAQFAIGIRELKNYFDGDCSLEQAKEMIKYNSRHYARRQLTWFRKDKRIKWIEVDSARCLNQIINKIAKTI
ncbi:MAG: tRNA (adenosine(37)-N6)-dimethylallyltransferase MiaA [Candidatus Omnitrophica bacterium]|nr:tRNA (adenosine(37)-N6)-dimethylallyltransferase MiaA [Candidatus Omnitrophota bacterium]